MYCVICSYTPLREKIEKKVSQRAEHDALIALLRQANAESGEAGLAKAIKARSSRIDVGLFLRMADLAEATASDEERTELINLSQAIMSVIESTGADWQLLHYDL